MYEAYFGLHEPPFHVTADPTFLFPSQQHQEALDHLIYGIRQRLGFIQITGEVGTGKTTLVKAFLAQVPEAVTTSVILNPDLSGTQMLEAVALDFGLQRTWKNHGGLMQALSEFFLSQQRQGRTPVLIIDEAQALKSRTLEQIRRLSNLETHKEKLLQIVLVGQPELETKLKEPLLRPLQQRIAVRYQLKALTAEETARYIAHRIDSAGGKPDRPRFTPQALEKIHVYAQGFPRLINSLCDKILLSCYVKETFTVDESLVRQAIETAEGISQNPEVHHEYDLGSIEKSTTTTF